MSQHSQLFVLYMCGKYSAETWFVGDRVSDSGQRCFESLLFPTMLFFAAALVVVTMNGNGSVGEIHGNSQSSGSY
ncbi:MAG: hypothetical protein ABI053_00795 [Lacisediminihabitans sp.]